VSVGRFLDATVPSMPNRQLGVKALLETVDSGAGAGPATWPFTSFTVPGRIRPSYSSPDCQLIFLGCTRPHIPPVYPFKYSTGVPLLTRVALA